MSYLSKISQNVVADNNNSYTGNLTAGAIFTGSGTSTLGIVGIQVSLKTDQDCITYVDQSSDGSNWDVVDSFEYYTLDGGQAWTTQAVNSFCRVRVKNNGTSTTSYFRLQTALCPIVEAVPRSLDEDGNFKVGIKSIEDHYGFEMENTPMGEGRMVEPFRLVGASFVGTTIDNNFWSGITGLGGTAVQSGGQITLSTNTTSGNAYAYCQTIRSARYIGGSSNRFRGTIQLGDVGETNNSRKWGAFDGSNGCYFELDGTNFYVVTLKNGSETRVASTNWNTNTSVPTLTSANTYEIYWTNSKVYFSIGDTVRHVVSASSSTWADTVSLPVRLSTTNVSGLQTNKTLSCRVATICRLGRDRSENIYKNISSATTTVCKYGAGSLHRIVVNNPTNNAITIYDNIAAAGNVIGIINPGSSATPFELNYGCPFFSGLTIVTAGSPNLTIIYE